MNVNELENIMTRKVTEDREMKFQDEIYLLTLICTPAVL